MRGTCIKAITVGTRVFRMMLLAALVVTPAATAGAQPRPDAPGGGQAQGGPAPADQEIVMELHHQGQSDIALARIAEERASSADVRSLAATVRRDHAAVNDRLLDYARAHKMDLGDILNPYDALPHGALETADVANSRGAELDARYLTEVIADQQRQADAAAAAQKIARDPQLVALLGELIPVYRRNEQAAAALQARRPPAAAPRVQLPGEPSTVSRTRTGIDERRGAIP